jgi:hypothetical protein
MRRIFPPRAAWYWRSLLAVLSVAGFTWLGARVDASRAGAAHGPAIGVNLHPLQGTYAAVPAARELDLARSVGASIVRIDIHWSWLEFREPGESTWYRPQVRALDAFLDAAAKRHIQVVATVLDTPCWAAASPGQSCDNPAGWDGDRPPLHPSAYAGFLRRLVAHVGVRIQYYEIWNEPNIAHFWHDPHPAAYTRLLKAAYRAIKQVNPAATVLAGATAGADVRFLEGMYTAGAMGSFDAISIHPYSGDRSPTTCTDARDSFACGVETVRAAMLRHNDRQPIWLTEWGVEVSAQESEAMQAQYLRQGLSLIPGWPYVRAALWYELYDDPSGRDGQHYGLYDRSLSPRQAAAAFQRAGTPTAGFQRQATQHTDEHKHRGVAEKVVHGTVGKERSAGRQEGHVPGGAA